MTPLRRMLLAVLIAINIVIRIMKAT